MVFFLSHVRYLMVPTPADLLQVRRIIPSYPIIGTQFNKEIRSMARNRTARIAIPSFVIYIYLYTYALAYVYVSIHILSVFHMICLVVPHTFSGPVRSWSVHVLTTRSQFMFVESTSMFLHVVIIRYSLPSQNPSFTWNFPHVFAYAIENGHS